MGKKKNVIGIGTGKKKNELQNKIHTASAMVRNLEISLMDMKHVSGVMLSNRTFCNDRNLL